MRAMRPVSAIVSGLVVLAACSSPPTTTVPPSQTPSATPSASLQSSPDASPTPDATATSPTPSPTPSLAPGSSGFGLDDILRVEVDGLAVRTAPYDSVPLATGWRDGSTNIGDVRLNTGDHVSVDLGPLEIGDTTWYRVWPAEDARLHYSTVWWDTRNDGPNPVEPGWVAASVGGATYLSLFEAADREPWLDGLPLLLSGVGDFESGPFDGFDLYSIDWAYVIDDQSAPCDFTVSMASVDTGASVVVVEDSTIGGFGEGVARVGSADGNPVVGDALSPLVLRIRNGCEWTLRLQALPHD